MDYKLIISIIAILISVISLVFNIWSKKQSESKKLQIKSYKSKDGKGYHCVVTITNIGKKTLYLRSISLEEKLNGKSISKSINYNYYREQIENKPLNPEDWKTFIFYDDKNLSFFDNENRTYKTTRFIIKDSKGKIYKTKWFRQNNLR